MSGDGVKAQAGANQTGRPQEIGFQPRLKSRHGCHGHQGATLGRAGQKERGFRKAPPNRNGQPETQGTQAWAAAQRLGDQPATRRFPAQAGEARRGARIPVAGQCAHQEIRRQAQADTPSSKRWSEKVRHRWPVRLCGAAGNAGCKSAVVERKASRRSPCRRDSERRRADRTAHFLPWRGTTQWGLTATSAPILRSAPARK